MVTEVIINDIEVGVKGTYNPPQYGSHDLPDLPPSFAIEHYYWNGEEASENEVAEELDMWPWKLKDMVEDLVLEQLGATT